MNARMAIAVASALADSLPYDVAVPDEPLYSSRKRSKRWGEKSQMSSPYATQEAKRMERKRQRQAKKRNRK